MADPILAEQFEDLAKQKDAARLGMWAFLGSEILLFAGLFALYASYRTMYPRDFSLGIEHNDVAIGTTNTFVLLTSSFTVALAVHMIRSARSKTAGLLLLVSILFGVVFLLLKGFEYWEHLREGIYPGGAYSNAEMTGQGAKIFFTIYYLSTGLHAFHVTAGMGVLAWLMWGSFRGTYSGANDTRVELGAMYWHLVDVVWIFLWPCLYLMHE